MRPQNKHREDFAQLIRERLDALRGRKSASQVANEIGYQRDSIIYLFAAGETRVPLDRAIALAQALEVEPGRFFRGAFECYMELPLGLDITFDRLKASTDERNSDDSAFLADELDDARETDQSADAAQPIDRSPVLVDLNFKVAPEFRRHFRIEAAQLGMSMKELLEAAFKIFREANR
jgi:hypothetical protein